MDRPLLIEFVVQVVAFKSCREYSSEQVIAELPVRAIDSSTADDVGEGIIAHMPKKYGYTYSVSVREVEPTSTTTKDEDI